MLLCTPVGPYVSERDAMDYCRYFDSLLVCMNLGYGDFLYFDCTLLELILFSPELVKVFFTIRG